MKNLKSKRKVISVLVIFLIAIICGCIIFFALNKNNNLASNKSISATAPSFADRLNDGDKTKAWSQEICPAMFEVDLGDTYSLNNVKFYGFDDNENYHQYKVLGSADGRTYEVCGEKKDKQADNSDGDDVELSNNMVARYVRFDITYASKKNASSVREVEIYGDKTNVSVDIPSTDPLDSNNVAYQKNVTSNLAYMSPRAVTSGDLNNYFRAEYTPVYVDIDLEQQYKINDVVLFFAECNNYYYYKVYGSNDGNNFTTLYTKGSENKSLPNANGDIIPFSNSPQYRFIRVYLQYQNTNGTASLAEVRVHGTPTNVGKDVNRDKSIDDVLGIKPFNETQYANKIDKTETINNVEGIIKRLVPQASFFKFELDTEYKDELDYFSLSENNGIITVKGNNGLMLASGANYYLKQYCNVNITEQTIQGSIPNSRPSIGNDTSKHVNHAKVRYSYNYCTLDYSFAFYNYEQWQRELDYLAINGVNLMLDLAGQEAVWIKFLQNFGYSYDAAKAWLTGPAYYAWQFMSNMDVYGGAVSDGFVKQRLEFARESQRWRRSLGMQTCLQGYAGMIPNDFHSYQPNVPILEQGPWNGFDRPDMIRTDNEYYKDFARKFYDAQKWVYGDQSIDNANHYYAVDPFHEGGIKPKDLTSDKISDAVISNLLEADEDAVWVIQAWHANPSTELLNGIAPYDSKDNKSQRRIDHTLILDLTGIGIGDLTPKWNTKHYEHEEEGVTNLDEEQFNRTPWVLGLLESYGGNPSMDGRLLQMVEQYAEACNNDLGGRNFFSGIGMLSEGTLDNPIAYNLFYDLPWVDASQLNSKDACKQWLNAWLDKYLNSRYDTSDINAYQARDGWNTLTYNSIYSGCVLRTNPFVMNQIPGIATSKINEFNIDGLKESNTQLENAFKKVVEYNEGSSSIGSKFDELAKSEGYRYDVVDMMRQIINNTSVYLYKDLMKDYENKDANKFQQDEASFMALYDLMDAVLACNQTWLGGQWIGEAQDLGEYLRQTDGDFAYDSFVDQAKSIITTWGNQAAANHLEGYAQRTYQGIMMDVYKVRWSKYLEDMRLNILDSNHPCYAQKKGEYFDTFREWMFSDKSNNYTRNANDNAQAIKALALKVIKNGYYLTK